MRQTNIIRHCHDGMKYVLYIMLLVLSCVATLHADVANVAVNTTFPGTGNRINGAGYVNLEVTWLGDSPTFTAKYKINNAVITTESAISDQSTTARIQAATIGDTNGAAVPIVVQIVDSAGKTAEGSSQGVIVDTKAPVLTASVINGPNFSQNSTVRVQINSNKEVKLPTVTCNGVAGTQEGTLTTGTSFVFNIKLTSEFSNGSYNVDINAIDLTEPATGANSGSTRCSFNVGTSASGATTIESATPASPSNSPTVSLKGTAPQGVAKISLLEGTKEITSINTNATDWSMTITPEEGSHNYIVVSYDSLNQEISRSSAFNYVIDKTAPGVPTVATEGIPTQTNATSVSLTVSVEGYSAEVTPPVMLQGYCNNNPVGSKFNITSSGSPVNVTIPLTDGTNVIYFKTTDAAGNESANSASISINKSSSATAAVASALIDSFSIPAPAKSMLGIGSHSFNITFNQPVSSANPTVKIICGGGSTIETKGSWKSNTEYVGSFTIPLNGGATVDGSATLSVTDVKDTFGNVLPEYVQAAAFVIDSTAPTSTINGETNIFVSANKQTIPLSGTVNDGTGSGIDYLTLIVIDPTGAETTTNVPLQTSAVSPWTYTYDASSLSGSGTYVLKTSATDRALPVGNTESYVNKPGINIIVDKTAPVVSRISLNNTGIDMVDEMLVASDVTRIVAVASESGAGLDFNNSNYILTLAGPEGNISGEKTNNGIDTVYFDFPTLTASGTYTITFTPIDKAGNTGETVTKRFSINKSAPDQAEFNPPAFAVANNSESNLANSEVRVTLSSTGASTPSYANSTISVKYNGNEVGRKESSETEELVAKLHNGTLKADGSHDGNYYITVVPYSTSGIAGNAINSSFVYDTLPPVVTESSPSILASPTWFGTGTNQFSITVSDSPKDILEHYENQYSPASAPVAPADTTWFNGSGSGINFEVSSYSWSMEGQSAQPFTHIGNKLFLQAPNPPASGSEGVADVEVTITLADNVTKGEIAPNKNTFTRKFKFDYMAPRITVQTKNGSKFRGNVLKVKALAEDLGEDPNLCVTQVEYTEDNGNTWIPVTASQLPAKAASLTIDIDISNKADGNYTVKFRAIDKGNNMSDQSEFAYVVDRTPPVPPELTIPLPDYTLNKRTQNYKWTKIYDADAYVLQISDDSSFNNILNTSVSADYPSLKGNVCGTPDGSFSLPKDGTYYWRVASLEKCEDGYNISDYSETRRTIVDSVKPYILSVSPSPSSSNTVSTGMVTFTIRFSETIDATINLSATLTSAGGQVMKIEKISCTGDTWTGTTVIPKNNSSVYDGTAVIAVQGASDLAGNLMTTDTSHTIVINTGPAFTTKLFSNPANEYEITILTKASESLQNAPSVYVKQNSTKTPVTMNFLKDRFYSGSYKIDKENPGAAYITISGSDLYGMIGNSTVEFRIADVNASSRLSLTTSSGRSSLKAAEGSTYKPTSVFLIERDCLESPFSGEETINSSVRASAGIRASATSKNKELIGVLGLDEIGPSNTKLKKCMLYTADVNGENINVDASKVHIYRQDSNGKWIFQGGTLKDYKISAQLTGLGRLALMADLTAPRLSSMSPANNEKLDTLKPEIKGQFEDNGSGLETSSFILSIDGLKVPGVEMENDGSFKYKPQLALKPGKHVIDVEVKDNAGNTQRRSFSMETPLFAEGEFRPYPNPARGNYIKFAYNFGAVPENVSLKIYDSAGHQVIKFGTGDFVKSGNLRWDLTNQKGKRVANGTYIYRLEYTANGQKIKKRGKLSILK